MKRLKISTICKFLVQHGWKVDSRGDNCPYIWVYYIPSMGLVSPLVITLGYKGEFRIRDFRHPKWCNLHLNSYWDWPKTMKELQATYDSIKQMYSTIGDVRFELSI